MMTDREPLQDAVDEVLSRLNADTPEGQAFLEGYAFGRRVEAEASVPFAASGLEHMNAREPLDAATTRSTAMSRRDPRLVELANDLEAARTLTEAFAFGIVSAKLGGFYDPEDFAHEYGENFRKHLDRVVAAAAAVTAALLRDAPALPPVAGEPQKENSDER